MISPDEKGGKNVPEMEGGERPVVRLVMEEPRGFRSLQASKDSIGPDIVFDSDGNERGRNRRGEWIGDVQVTA